MNKGRSAAAILAVLLVGGAGLAWVGAATASSGGVEDVEGTLALTPATVEQGGAVFYDVDTLAGAWSAAVTDFDPALPSGYRLVPDLPSQFSELGPGDNLFEAQIVDMTLATNYRCAWLDAGLVGQVTEAEVSKALETYWKLPSVAEFDQTGLDTDLEAIAANLGYKDTNRALFDLTCNGWEK